MSHERPNAGLLDEELVAYLDGELDAESARRIEALLASDPQTRRRLESLERTWDLLDELDTAPVGEPFTQTTLEMVAVAADRDAERDRIEAPGRRRRNWKILGLFLLASALAGFAAVALFWPNPNRRLLEDLPVLEALDEYRQVESIDYLRKLRDEGLFEASGDTSVAEMPPMDENIAARRFRIEAMSSREKEELLRLVNRFAFLASKERERLGELHSAMQNAPDAAQLRAVMYAYCSWLRGLSSYRRAELAEMPEAERLVWVKSRRESERRRRQDNQRLEGRDLLALLKWTADCASRHEKSFLASLPEKPRQWLAQSNKQTRRMAFWVMWQRGQLGERGKTNILTDDDLARLRASLSPSTRKRLEALPISEQWRQVALWIHQAARHPNVAPDRFLPKTTDQRVSDFFENELSDEDRERLMNMPPEEMLRELHRLFFMRMGPPIKRPRFHHDARPPDHRPDDQSQGWPDRPPGDRPPRRGQDDGTPFLPAN